MLRRVGETKAVSAAYENSIPITAAETSSSSDRVFVLIIIMIVSFFFFSLLEFARKEEKKKIHEKNRTIITMKMGHQTDFLNCIISAREIKCIRNVCVKYIQLKWKCSSSIDIYCQTWFYMLFIPIETTTQCCADRFCA